MAMDQPNPPIPAPPIAPTISRRRWPWVVLALFIFACIGAYAGMAMQFGPDPQGWTTAEGRCRYQSRSYVAGLKPLITEWDDANQLAGQTSRIALSPQIARLQELRRRAADLPGPSCINEVRTLATEYMDATIDSYLSFMAQDPDMTVNNAFIQAQTKQSAFVLAYAKLQP